MPRQATASGGHPETVGRSVAPPRRKIGDVARVQIAELEPPDLEDSKRRIVMTDGQTDGRTLAARYLKGLNDHDPDAVDGFVAVDYVNHNEFVADGREANRAWWSSFFTAFPDIEATMDDLVIAGDRVVGRFTYRGTHTGPLYGVPATGKADRDAFDRHLADRERRVRGALGRTQPPRPLPADRRDPGVRLRRCRVERN